MPASTSPAESPSGEKIYESSFAEPVDRLAAYADFVAIVKQLRRDCPWDREQTHASVKHLLVEEAYETVEAIEDEDWDGLAKELGDLLLHVVFHATIAEEGGRFTLRDVIEAETAKLVRRHPHVFGEGEAASTGEVLRNWERIKMTEGKRSVLDGVPRALPSLLRAYRMQEKAAGVGFDFPAAAGAWEKVEEEIGEFRALADAPTEADAPPVAPPDASLEAQEAEFGDLLFALVNYARLAGLNPENALRATNAKFERRFLHIERRLAADGRTPADADLGEMDRLWDEAKAGEG